MTKKSNKFIYVYLGAATLASSVDAQQKQPNIILLTADDLGWNDISSAIATMGNGSKNHQTPNIDKFAAESMVFTSAYACHNSAPTRAALLTGQYANRTHVYNVWGLDRYSKNNQKGIKKDEARIVPADQKQEFIQPGTVTVAQLLKEAGYDTYIFGKVHGFKMTDTNDNGFTHNFQCKKSVKGESDDESEGKSDNTSNYYAYKTSGGEWIFDNPKYNKFAKPYTKEYIRKNLIPCANGNNPMLLEGTKKHFTDAIGDVVIDEISKTDSDKPFFMWVAFHAIHSVIVGRDDLNEKYKTRTKIDERHPNFKYAALTEQLDQTVARILDAIDDPNGDGNKAESIRENTIVIFISDNGGVHGGNHSNAPLRWAKGTLYEGGIRVPMMVRYPKMTNPSTISDEPIHVVDFMPTLLDLANASNKYKNHKIDGESFVPILSGKKQNLKRDAIYWHFPGYMDERGIPASVVNKRIDGKRYKYRYNYEYDLHELFNLTDDIGEKINLLENPTKENLKIGNKLLKDLRKWIDKTKPLPMYYVDTNKKVELPKRIE